MVIEQKQDDQIVFGSRIIETGIDAEDLPFVKQALSGKIYSSKYSFISENIQNATDIHKEVNTDKKVKVGFDIDDSGRFIFFQDWGTGISLDLMENVVAKFGKSTKRNDNNANGGFGIGFFANLAFTDKCFIITNVNGFEYTYLLTDNNGAEFQLLTTKETNEPNGTIIKVYISSGYYEFKEVRDNLRRLAAYFEGVDCSEFSYPLVKNEHFYFSQDFDGDDNIHICYGKGYYYPVPWKLLNIKPIPIKVAIPFNTGELKPSLNRETLQLEKSHLELIETKLLNLMSYFKANVKTEFDDIYEYLEAKKGSKVEFVKGLWISYNDLGINDLVYTPLKELELKEILPDLSWGSINKTKCELTRNNTGYCNRHYKSLLIKDKDLLNTKYFRNYVQGATVIDFPRINLNKWIAFLKLKRFPKSEWRRLINLYSDWFKTEFKVTTFTELRDSQEFKDYVAEEKKNIVRQQSCKRDSVTWIARWGKNEKSVVWDSNLSENNGDKIYVTNKTPKDKIEFLMSLISNTKIQMIRSKVENYDWVEEDNIVATVYYSMVISEFLDSNVKWIKIAKQCLSKDISLIIKKLEDFTYHNKTVVSVKIDDFKKTLGKLVELHGLTDHISKDLEIIENLVKEYEYFNWMDHDYYRPEKAIKMFNYIQSLKSNQ